MGEHVPGPPAEAPAAALPVVLPVPVAPPVVALPVVALPVVALPVVALPVVLPASVEAPVVPLPVVVPAVAPVPLTVEAPVEPVPPAALLPVVLPVELDGVLLPHDKQAAIAPIAAILDARGETRKSRFFILGWILLSGLQWSTPHHKKAAASRGSATRRRPRARRERTASTRAALRPRKASSPIISFHGSVNGTSMGSRRGRAGHQGRAREPQPQDSEQCARAQSAAKAAIDAGDYERARALLNLLDVAPRPGATPSTPASAVVSFPCAASRRR